MGHYVGLHIYDLYCLDNYYMKPFCSCCFEKKITNIIFKIPIGPAQSQHSITEKNGEFDNSRLWLSCVRGHVHTFPFRLYCKTSKSDLS